MKKVLVPLADGFEEIEAISIIDVLRRAGADVVIASVNGAEIVTSDRSIRILVDCRLDSIDVDEFDMIALPGGYEGAMTLAKSELPQKIIKLFHAKDKFVAAICAAPYALHTAGVLENVEFTCYPGMDLQITSGLYTENKNVVVSNKIITSRGPATALAFSLSLVESLFGMQKAKELAAGMLKTCC